MNKLVSIIIPVYNVEKYIKRWSNLSKYNRKINLLKLIIGKLIIKSYFKNK